MLSTHRLGLFTAVITIFIKHVQLRYMYIELYELVKQFPINNYLNSKKKLSLIIERHKESSNRTRKIEFAC